MAKFTVDLTDETPETIDRGRSVEAGWYKCVLDDVYDDSKNGDTVCEWKVMEGKYRDAKIFDRLRDPALATEGKHAEMSLRRIKVVASRLGLIKTDAYGQQADIDFMDAIGQEAVLQVKHRKYKDKDGNEQEIDGVDFAGVYPLDHEKIPADVRKALGLPPAKTGDGPGGKPSAKTAAANNGPARPPAAAAAPATVNVDDL